MDSKWLKVHNILVVQLVSILSIRLTIIYWLTNIIVIIVTPKRSF